MILAHSKEQIIYSISFFLECNVDINCMIVFIVPIKSVVLCKKPFQWLGIDDNDYSSRTLNISASVKIIGKVSFL